MLALASAFPVLAFWMLLLRPQHIAGVHGVTIFGFKSQSALAANIRGRDCWLVTHGAKPNSHTPGAGDHEQHLVLCTQVPQALPSESVQFDAPNYVDSAAFIVCADQVKECMCVISLHSKHMLSVESISQAVADRVLEQRGLGAASQRGRRRSGSRSGWRDWSSSSGSWQAAPEGSPWA